MDTQEVLRSLSTFARKRHAGGIRSAPSGGGGVFKAAGLPCEHEYRPRPARRIDFFLDGVGVEIKKGRPNARELLKQVERYLACDELKEIVVVTQKDTPLPAYVLGKRVTCISLDRLWGVALP